MMFDRFNTDTRAVMNFAAQEAADLGSHQIGTDHLILGMLCNARSPLFTVLTEQGLTLTAAREVVQAGQTADAAEQTRDRYDEDREALRSIGIDLDKVREAVGGRFGEDLSDGWGRRPEPRRGRGRGGRCGPADGGRGRRGPRGRGRGGRLSDAARDAIGAAVGSVREHRDRERGDCDHRDRDLRGRDLRDRDLRDRDHRGLDRRDWESRDWEISVQRLLLAILDGADPAAVAVVESATTVDDLRTAVLATLPEAPAGR